MPPVEDLLTPIAGENPSGCDLRYDTEHAFYDRIQEALRQDDDLPVGDWQRERKVANYADALKLSQEALATQSKDLQIAAWLTEALLHKEGFGGLAQGFQICHQLLDGFWETLYPPVEDGDAELRAKPLNWIGSALEIPVKSVPITKGGYDWIRYKESRTVGYEEQAQTDTEKAKRAAMVKGGKLTPEAFDKAFDETPKSFYAKAERDLDSSLSNLISLEKFCDEKFEKAAPSFSRLKSSLEEVRRTVHSLLEKKRELEPDPVEAQADSEQQGAGESEAGGSGNAPATAHSIVIPFAHAEPVERRQAIVAIAKAAAALRKQQPGNPAPYLMMRGLRWGELRASPGLKNPDMMEAPTTELRQHLKLLALASNWSELLDVAENAMSLPCSRAWLDLQHLVVLACRTLGEEYALVEAAIVSELKNLLRDIPELLNAVLLDGTPAANNETRDWLSGLMAPPPALAAEVQSPAPTEGTDEATPAAAAAPVTPSAPSSWWEKPADAYVLAQAAVRAGNLEKGVALMRAEIARQQSGRARFQRTLQFVQLCVEAGHEAIVQPMIDDVAEALESHKLDDWEDRAMVADALVLIMKTSKKVQGDSSQRQKLFERVCRLDPVRALHAG